MNTDFIIRDGVLERYTGTDENVIIPDGVEEIGVNAFCGSVSVRSVTVNGDIARIGWCAFDNCQKLESFTVKGKIKIICALAFHACFDLKEFNVAASPEKIGAKAFAFCGRLRPELTKLLDSPGRVGEEAFSGTGAECVTIVSNTGSTGPTHRITADWGRKAFAYCGGLKKVVFSENAECVSEGMFESCEALTDVTFLGNTHILARAFKACHSLRKIAIKSSTIHEEAFMDCTALKNVSFVEDDHFCLGRRVFYGCTDLEEIVLPKGVDYISHSMFACCLKLKSVTIPDSVDMIMSNAFRSCISLEHVRIGEKVGYIAAEAFFGCRNLTDINIPESVEKIGDNAFAECDMLSLSVNPAILRPGSDIFGSTYGLDNAGEITDEEAEKIIYDTTT